MVIKMDAASHWLSERVGVQLTIFPSEFFTKKEQLLGPLLSLLVLQPAFPAELLAASRHWGRNSSGADKWQMTLASNCIKECEHSRVVSYSPLPVPSSCVYKSARVLVGTYYFESFCGGYLSVLVFHIHFLFYNQCLSFLLENHSLTSNQVVLGVKGASSVKFSKYSLAPLIWAIMIANIIL